MLKILLRVLVTAGALLLIAHYIPGIAIAGFATALLVAVIWGLVNLIVKPILMILTLPITIITFGLFAFILNALLFWLVGILVPGFTVAGFLPALEGSFLLSVVGWVLHAAL